MKTTYKRNLLVGFGVSLLILIVTAAASFISIRSLLDSSWWVNHTHIVIQDLDNIISVMKDAETGQRGFLLTGNEEYLEPYHTATAKTDVMLAKLRDETGDNPQQRINCAELEALLKRRFEIFKRSIDSRRAGEEIDLNDLTRGKMYMDDLRAHVEKMKKDEEALLISRTESMNRFASFTPILIILASALAIAITIVFYVRVSRDFSERILLQKELERKDEDIMRRIAIIENIASKISAGEYSTRVEDSESDSLGSLAGSLNRMAQSLDNSFTLLSDKEWYQAGVAGLNDTMVGEKTVPDLTYGVLEYLTRYTNSAVGAVYLADNDHLFLSSSIALKKSSVPERIPLGEGVVGQAAVSAKMQLLSDVPGNMLISFASGEVKPGNVIALPLFHERKLKGVIEMGALTPYTPREIDFLTSITSNIGLGISTAKNRKRLQELLEETQAQTEELQSQHNELESLNAEMEAQTQKLQASEEELKVQQEELLQANQELEERTRLLEEKNQIIIERNMEVQRKADELAQSTRYKSEFLANMSHELRTPLNSILLLSRLMAENNEQNLSPDQIEYARVIQSSGNGLLSLIDEILDLSKIESGKMDLELADVQISEITADMESMFNPLAREKALEFRIETSHDIPVTIYTDKLRLEQILRNLLSNAFKFTARGYVRVEIQMADATPYIEFSVKDTGIGIPLDKQAQVFEAFQQADGSTRRKFGGTGLGLSISRELAKLLGGEIRLSSQPEVGSDFTVSIPATKEAFTAPKEASPRLLIEDQWPKPAKDLTAEERSKFVAPSIPHDVEDDRKVIDSNDKVVLIIEDDTSFAGALMAFTRQRGYKGVVSVRGDHAVDLARQFKPIAILLDIVLPVKSGWDVMDELKSNPETRHIPVHIMSSMEVKKESLVKGAVDFINKPVAIDQMQEMFTKLEAALNRDSRKVVILEENTKHAQALSYYLENFNVATEIAGSINDGANAIQKEDVDCVILDMGIPAMSAYEALEMVKKNPALQDLPVIIFTGKSISKVEETRIRQYADSIVVKTAHSYQRILDEVALFLHLIEEKEKPAKPANNLSKLGVLNEVLKDKKVLIADDDVRNIYSITKALEFHKMQVVAAVDGKEALRQLEEHPDVDVVLMDMMMPEMDGYESTMKIRQNPKHRNLPILAVTAKAMMGDREKCISAGASDYITKPVDMDQLISLLRVWLYDKGF